MAWALRLQHMSDNFTLVKMALMPSGQGCWRRCHLDRLNQAGDALMTTTHAHHVYAHDYVSTIMCPLMSRID